MDDTKSSSKATNNRLVRTKLTKRGYSLFKKDLTKKEIRELRKELTVKPYVHNNYGAVPVPYPVYLESCSKLYLPRTYGLQKFGEPDVNKIKEGQDIEVSFTQLLREKQKPIVDAYIKSSKTTNGGGIICVPCGYGKTVIALYLLAQLKKKTLIIVHKSFLMNQWIERIKMFLNPEIRIGKIQGKTCNIVNKDIVLGMLQSVSMKEYPEDMFDEFGMVIFDECHHLSAEVFSRALIKVSPKYLLGLSATPNRKDGLSKVFRWFLGDYVYNIKKREDEDVDVCCVKFIDMEPSYKKTVLNYYGKMNMAQMINNICAYKPRTKCIIKYIKPLILEGRKILILSDRREHLKVIKQYLDSKEICDSGYYLGGMKQKELKVSEQKQVLLATYSMASEGFDVPTLNTLVLASPKSNIVQSVGRILRQRPENRKYKPYILDIVDVFSIFKNQAKKRRSYYLKCSYHIIDDNYNKND